MGEVVAVVAFGLGVIVCVVVLCGVPWLVALAYFADRHPAATRPVHGFLAITIMMLAALATAVALILWIVPWLGATLGIPAG